MNRREHLRTLLALGVGGAVAPGVAPVVVQAVQSLAAPARAALAVPPVAACSVDVVVMTFEQSTGRAWFGHLWDQTVAQMLAEEDAKCLAAINAAQGH